MSEVSLKLSAFEGPLDLLLHLIEKDKLDIYDIPIVSITEQYIAYLKQLQSFDMELASEFLVMAATLLQIKSRMLLPKPPVEEEEEEDPRERLVEMLVEYRRIKQAAAALRDMKSQADRYVQRKSMFAGLTTLLMPHYEVSSLLEALAGLVESRQERSAYIEPQAFSVQEKMTEILELLEVKAEGFPLSQVFSTGTPGEKVAAFLGVLELLKMRLITISQSKRFAPIYIFRTSEVDDGAVR